MIKFVHAKNPYKPDHADLICDFQNEGSSKYLTLDQPTSEKTIPLSIVDPNPWTALAKLGIDYKQLCVRYECPYTHYEHFAIVPTALLVNGNIEIYKKVNHFNPDFVLDWEWHLKMIPDLLTIGKIGKILLGSGYTDMNNVFDGSGAIIQCRAVLDNGDMVHCYTWEWYNK